MVNKSSSSSSLRLGSKGRHFGFLFMALFSSLQEKKNILYEKKIEMRRKRALLVAPRCVQASADL
jgi:hypothetical protein